MHARVSRYTGDAAAMKQGFEAVAPELEHLTGFHHAYFLTDAASGRAVSITLWDGEDALEWSAERAHQMRTDATEPSDATVESVEGYEVVLTVRARAATG